MRLHETSKASNQARISDFQIHGIHRGKLMTWRKLLSNIFFRAPEDEHYPSDKYCCICEGRFWPWTDTIRIESLGMTRAHYACAANFLKHELENVKRVQNL